MVINISNLNLNAASGSVPSGGSVSAPVEISTLDAGALAALYNEIQASGFPKGRYMLSMAHQSISDTGIWGGTHIELTTWMVSGNEFNEGNYANGFGTLSSPQGVVAIGCNIYSDGRLEIFRP